MSPCSVLPAFLTLLAAIRARKVPPFHVLPTLPIFLAPIRVSSVLTTFSFLLAAIGTSMMLPFFGLLTIRVSSVLLTFSFLLAAIGTFMMLPFFGLLTLPIFLALI
jgi:hypothetical protein